MLPLSPFFTPMLTLLPYMILFKEPTTCLPLTALSLTFPSILPYLHNTLPKYLNSFTSSRPFYPIIILHFLSFTDLILYGMSNPITSVFLLSNTITLLLSQFTFSFLLSHTRLVNLAKKVAKPKTNCKRNNFTCIQSGKDLPHVISKI